MAQKRLPHGVKVGDTIRITKLDDPYDHSYVGREGVVEFIDSMDQIHGSSDASLVALTLMIAESHTEEMDTMVKVVVSLINRKN